MVSGRSIEDRILHDFLASLEAGSTVSPAVISELAKVIRQADSYTADQLLSAIRNGVRGRAKD